MRYRREFDFTIRISWAKNIVHHVFCVFLTFGLIFNLNFSAFPSLTLGRLSVILLICAYFGDLAAMLTLITKRFGYFIISLFFLMSIALFWVSINGVDDVVMFSRLFWFFIFTIVGTLLYMRMVRFKLFSAMWFYLMAILAQVVFVFCSVLDPGFREWVSLVLVESGNIDFSEGVRFSGFSNGGGATLSVQLSLGVVASLVLFYLTNNPAIKVFLLLAALSITAATVFVGRTGFWVSLATLAWWALLSWRQIWLIAIIFTSISIGVAYILSVASGDIELNVDELKLERTANWVLEDTLHVVLYGKSSTLDTLIDQSENMREMTVSNFLFGSGRVQEHDGLNYSGHDSGYIHLIYALGFPLSVLFYGTLLALYLDIQKKVCGKLKLIGLFLIFLVFLLEIKEPFVFKYTLPFFVFVYLFLAGCRQAKIRAHEPRIKHNALNL